MLTTTSRRARSLSQPLALPLQRRGFRFGPWGSSEKDDAELHKDTTRKRHRALRYRYMESLNRRASWDGVQPSLDGTKAALKKAMSDAIRSSDRTRVANVKNVGTVDPFDGLRPGHNIEDVEREAIDHLFRPQASSPKAPLKNIQKYLKAQRTPRDVTPGEVLRATAAVDEPEVVVIDPITNRRVQRGTSFTPKTEDVDVHTNLPRQAEADDFPDDAHKYGPVKWNEPDGLQKPTVEEVSNEYEDLDKYKPTKYDDPNAKLTPKHTTDSKYEDLGEYKPVRWNEPDGLEKPTTEEESKQYDDLNKYEQKKYDDPNAPRQLTPEEESKKYEDLKDYKAVSWNEPDGLQALTSEELSKNYDDLHKYGAVRWNEPNGLQKQSPEELSKNYDDLNQYKAVQWNEPDGLPQPTAEELTKNYTDLDKYGPVQWNEPDGLQKETPEEASKHYRDLGQYKPVAWNEPNGLPKPTPEEESKKYADLKAYAAPHVASDATLQAYIQSQMDTTPKGHVLPPKVEVAAENPGKEYKDLGAYGPVRWNEPDGLQKPTPEELSKKYEDLHLYGAVRWNEPNGLLKPTPEEQSKAYRDVHLYSSGPADAPQRIHLEEASKAYSDLKSYGPIRWNEPHGLQTPTSEEQSKLYKDVHLYSTGAEDVSTRVHPEEASKAYADLSSYGPVRWNEPDGISVNDVSQPPYGDLHAYAASREATATRHPEEVSKEYKDLDQYEPQSFDSPSEPYVAAAEGTASLESKHRDDFARYDPQQFDSSTYPPDQTTESPDLDSHVAQPKPDGSSGTVYTSSHGPGPSRGFTHYGALDRGSDAGLDSLTAREIRADVQKEKEEIKAELEEAKVEHDKSWDAATEDAQYHLKHAKSSYARFTGNYARDFPEDFSASWTETSSRTLLPEGAAHTTTPISPLPGVADSTMSEAELSSMDESFPGTKLESALDRMNGQLRRRKLEADPYSTAPQGLETSYHEECASSTGPSVVKHYGSSDKPGQSGQSDQSSGQGSSSAKLYKILAYDWKTDVVRVAETWSSVMEGATPALTPAEVMTRLSNPSKFFPYFAPLESQGYEIVSGTGDVLVFRRVREPALYPLPDPPSTPVTPEAAEQPPLPKGPAVNPIDLMGKPPVTGNFASPTGFVNYDNVTEQANKPAPPFSRTETDTDSVRSSHDRLQDQATYRSRTQSPTKERGKFRFVVKATAASVVTLYGIGMVLNWMEKTSLIQ